MLHKYTWGLQITSSATNLKEVTLISLTKRKLSGVSSKTNFQMKKKKKTLKGFPSYQIKS